MTRRMATFYFVTRQNESQMGNHHSSSSSTTSSSSSTNHSSSFAQENTLLKPQGGESTWTNDIIETERKPFSQYLILQKWPDAVNKSVKVEIHLVRLYPICVRQNVDPLSKIKSNKSVKDEIHLVRLDPGGVGLQLHVEAAVDVGRGEAEPSVHHVNVQHLQHFGS